MPNESGTAGRMIVGTQLEGPLVGPLVALGVFELVLAV